MSKDVQFPGGTEESEDAKVGLDRQVRVDTTRKELRLHDGVTPGGFRILGKAGVEQLIAASAEDAQGQLTLISDNAALQALVPEANMYAVVVAAGQEAAYFWRPGVGDAGTISSSHTGHWRRLDAQADTSIRLWRAGLINLQIEGAEPGSGQATTPWLNSGVLKLWDGSAYVVATQVLFGRLLLQGNGGTGSGLDADLLRGNAPGAGNGIDADLLDGQHAADFLQLSGGTLTGALGVPLGSLAAPAIHISGDTDTGLYSPGANQLDLGVGGVKAFGIDSDGIMVKPNTPSFRATNPQLSASAPLGLIFGTIQHNTGGHYNSANGRFTAPVDGKYLLASSIFFSQGASQYNSWYFRVNGGTALPYFHSPNSSTSLVYFTLGGCIDIELTQGDYVDVYYAAGTGATYSGGSYSHFSGHLIG